MNDNALAVARTFLDLEEVPGPGSNPMLLGIIQDVIPGATSDEIPWCSAFAFHVAKLLDLRRPAKIVAARARSWLAVGTPVSLTDARPGNDVVIFKRGGGHQPGPEVLDAPGHVAFFVGLVPGQVVVLGGNQGDAVTEARFQQENVLGVRRIYP